MDVTRLVFRHIDAAHTGDGIEVYSGCYPGEIFLNKNILLRGIDTGKGKPTIRKNTTRLRANTFVFDALNAFA